MKTLELLDFVKLRNGWPSDYRLGQALGFSRSNISNWRSGRNVPDAMACFKLAQAGQLDPAAVLAAIEVERAQHAGHDAAAQDWAALLRAHIARGAVAAGLAMCIAVPDAGAMPTQPTPAELGITLYIMLTK